jgi:hypothetical protein
MVDGAKCPICGRDSVTNECSHHVFSGDRTFPYATDVSGAPFEVYSKAFDVTLLGELNLALDPIITGGSEAIEKLRRTADLSPALSRLIDAIVAGVEQTNDGVERESSADLVAFEEYLDSYIETCSGYIGSTSWTQNTPFASSTYVDHWAKDAKACGDELERRINADLLSLGVEVSTQQTTDLK